MLLGDSLAVPGQDLVLYLVDSSKQTLNNEINNSKGETFPLPLGFLRYSRHGIPIVNLIYTQGMVSPMVLLYDTQGMVSPLFPIDTQDMLSPHLFPLDTQDMISPPLCFP